MRKGEIFYKIVFSNSQKKSIAEIVKDVGVEIFTGITVGVILEKESGLFAPTIAIFFSLLPWYSNLKITNSLKK